MKAEDRYDSMLQWYSKQSGLDWKLLKAQMLAESAGNPDAVSSVGAQGLFQAMPATWKDWESHTSPFNPEAAIRFGARYMAYLLRAFANDYRKALAAYNYGLGHITSLVSAKKAGWEVGLPAETKAYIERILT